MLFSVAATALALISSVAAIPFPQGVSADTIPACAELCITAKISEINQLAYNCSGVDIACYCTSTPFVRAYAQCLTDNCASQADLTAAQQFGEMFCADAGVAIGSASGSASASADSSASASQSAFVASVLESLSAASATASAVVSEVSSAVSSAVESGASAVSEAAPASSASA